MLFGINEDGGPARSGERVFHSSVLVRAGCIRNRQIETIRTQFATQVILQDDKFGRVCSSRPFVGQLAREGWVARKNQNGGAGHCHTSYLTPLGLFGDTAAARAVPLRAAPPWSASSTAARRSTSIRSGCPEEYSAWNITFHDWQ